MQLMQQRLVVATIAERTQSMLYGAGQQKAAQEAELGMAKGADHVRLVAGLPVVWIMERIPVNNGFEWEIVRKSSERLALLCDRRTRASTQFVIMM